MEILFQIDLGACRHASPFAALVAPVCMHGFCSKIKSVSEEDVVGACMIFFFVVVGVCACDV